jgi:hypothetical protein
VDAKCPWQDTRAALAAPCMKAPAWSPGRLRIRIPPSSARSHAINARSACAGRAQRRRRGGINKIRFGKGKKTCALDFFRAAAAHEHALSVVAEQDDLVRFVQGILHSRRAERHPGNRYAFCLWTFPQEALDHHRRDMSFDQIAVHLGGMAGRERIGDAVLWTCPGSVER